MPPRILIVDSDQVTIHWLQSKLTPVGYTVDTATRGDIALQKISHDPPNLIVLDLTLPDGNGLDLIRRLRDDPQFINVGIIIFSLRTEPDDIVAGLNAGADHYVRKRPGADKWKSDILWTGLIIHDLKRYPGEDLRYELVNRLVRMPNCAIYGCCGRPKIGGFDYLYAISGAKIGLSINGDNNIRLYHSSRLTHYLACGTFVLAKRVPDTDLLFKDGLHLRYFDTADEFFELAKWYLEHETERKKIADAGMQRVHTEFNCQKIAKYILELVEKGAYVAPWTGQE